MPEKKNKIPDAFGYALFSGTATMLAFFLPLVIWAIMMNRITMLRAFTPPVIDLFAASCLYHGYYRAKALAADLGATGKKLARWQLFFKIVMYLGLLILIIINLFFLF